MFYGCLVAIEKPIKNINPSKFRALERGFIASIDFPYHSLSRTFLSYFYNARD